MPRLPRLSTRFALTLAATLPIAGASGEAAARPDRRGAQAEVLFGGTGCVPGRAKCDAGGEIAGETGPLVGFGTTLGFRPLRVLMVGAAYNLGFFAPDYRQGGSDLYRRAYQHSVFAVARAILPIWRLDLGLEIGPGWSRQVFVAAADSPLKNVADLGLVRVDREYSQGLALKTAPVIDFYLTKRFFLGAKIDVIFNFHGEVCASIDGGAKKSCARSTGANQASVHQVIGGLHLGATF
jgi:hypothetical protein